MRLNHYTTHQSRNRSVMCSIWHTALRRKTVQSTNHSPLNTLKCRNQMLLKNRNTHTKRARVGEGVSPASPTPTSCLCDSVEGKKTRGREVLRETQTQPYQSTVKTGKSKKPPERQPSAKNEHAERKPPIKRMPSLRSPEERARRLTGTPRGVERKER